MGALISGLVKIWLGMVLVGVSNMEVGMSNSQKGSKRLGTGALTLHINLKLIQSANNLTVRQLASIAGVGPSVIHSWKSKHVPHNLKAVARIGKVFDVPLKDMLFEVIKL